MKTKVRWGVLGYARIARLSVIPAILKAKNSEFFAIASRDEDKLDECKKTFGVTKIYKNYEALLDDPEVDAVYIPLPNSLHKDWTIKAARKGKHILCEKPLALNTAQCLEMIEECKKNKVKLMEAFMYRYTERIKKVNELLDSGIIGEVRHINSTFRFFLDRTNSIKLESDLGGGSLYDVGCYPINFVGMVTRSTPISMSVENVIKDGVDISFSSVLKYQSGVIATINSGFDGFMNNFTQITGTKGIMDIPDTFQDNAGIITVKTADGIKEIEVPACERYVLEIEDFANAVLTQGNPMFSLEETLRNMEIIENLIQKMKPSE